METVYNTEFIKKFNLVILESDHLALASYSFNVDNYQSSLFERFSINFPEVIKFSVCKRQAEYLAGRYTARSALHNLGFEEKDIAIGKHRSPIWPTDITASITHTDSIAICVASYNRDHKYLSIDLEKRFHFKCIADIKDSIINLEEEILLLNSELIFEDALTLTFSAKESLFKALYPSVSAYFDFSAARISDICSNNNSFTLILLQDLTPELNAGVEYTGSFTFYKNHVFTMIAE